MVGTRELVHLQCLEESSAGQERALETRPAGQAVVGAGGAEGGTVGGVGVRMAGKMGGRVGG